jgi:hypothetical protein
MNIGKSTLAALVLTVTVLATGTANARFVTVGPNSNLATSVNVVQPGVFIANPFPVFFDPGITYVAPVGGSTIAGIGNSPVYNTGVNATVYNATGVAPFAGYGGAMSAPAPRYSSVPVGTTPYRQVVGQLYDPVTEACYARVDVYNYYTYDVYSGMGPSSFVGRYTDGPYYQTSYETSYPGACR